MNPQDELREEVVKEIYRIIEAEQDVVDKANNILLLIQREKARVAWEIHTDAVDKKGKHWCGKSSWTVGSASPTDKKS
jgi:hypothetical protein